MFVLWLPLALAGCFGDRPWNAGGGGGGGGGGGDGTTGLRGVVTATVAVAAASGGSESASSTYGLVQGATVFLESDRGRSTSSDASGGFLLAPLATGWQRVVAQFASQTATGIDWYKARSDAVRVEAGVVATCSPYPLVLQLATGNASGTVIDLVTGLPLAEVVAVNWGERFVTGSDGRFWFTNLPLGASLSLSLSALGYVPRTLQTTLVATLTDLGQVGLTPVSAATSAGSLTPWFSWASGTFETLTVFAGDQVYALGNDDEPTASAVWRIQSLDQTIAAPVLFASAPAGVLEIVPASGTASLTRGEAYTLYLAWASSTVTASGPATTTVHFERGFVAGAGDVALDTAVGRPLP